MSKCVKEGAGFKSLDDLRLCILALAALKDAAALGLPFIDKPAAPCKPRKEARGR